uniref:Long-chain-fatty-acid--CoA ligase n=1 Tax=Hemiscolopendra marginata TaxID=943146 RepID=A0A646QEB8_9MYRI
MERLDEYLHTWGGTTGALTVTAIAAASAYYYATRPTTMKPPIDLAKQSCIHPENEQVRVSCLTPDGNFLRYLYEDTKTLFDVMRRGARNSGNNKCLGWREDEQSGYQWLTYNEVITTYRNFGSGLIAKGLKPQPSTFIGIYSQNSKEWIITEYACYNYSMVIIPLYDTLGPEACSFIINQANIAIVVCDKDERVNLLLNEVNQTSSLKIIVHVKPVTKHTISRAQSLNVELVSFSDIVQLGIQQPHEDVPPKPSDLCTICYTSGTTGKPKGVMLTHENVVADVSAVVYQLGDLKPTKDDVMISFLPLAHMLERCCETALFMGGGSVGFYQGDIRLLMDDFQALKPTVTPAVPRLLNRIYDKVHSQVSSSKIKSYLLKLAINSKLNELKRGIVRNNSIWDSLVFKKVQQGMGGNVRLLVVGSAPLAGNVLTFIRCALGCAVVEGYGQTEGCAPCTLTIQGDWQAEHVGPPIPCLSIKLVDVPEMEYYSSENKGEVCIKGTNVFQGYFKDPVKTKEALDEDEWLHTGDIGMWLPNGALKIVDRKKHIFKLAQGEYIAPEKIENIYIRSSLVGQIFVHGESLQACLVAIVVPDIDPLMKWAKNNGVKASFEELCKLSSVKAAILEEMTSLGKKSGLKSFEQVKDIYVTSEPFTVENNLLTPTLKTKRPELKKYFMPQIEAMYRTLA